MATFIRSLAVVFCLAVVLFFALKPGPEVPRAMASDQIRIFLNSHDALRNQLAFGLFGIAALFALMTKRLSESGAVGGNLIDCVADSGARIRPDLDAGTARGY